LTAPCRRTSAWCWPSASKASPNTCSSSPAAGGRRRRPAPAGLRDGLQRIKHEETEDAAGGKRECQPDGAITGAKVRSKEQAVQEALDLPGPPKKQIKETRNTYKLDQINCQETEGNRKINQTGAGYKIKNGAEGQPTATGLEEGARGGGYKAERGEPATLLLEEVHYGGSEPDGVARAGRQQKRRDAKDCKSRSVSLSIQQCLVVCGVSCNCIFLCRIIEHYSKVQVDYVAGKISLPKAEVEKLSQMILDIKFQGILDKFQCVVDAVISILGTLLYSDELSSVMMPSLR
jgi:hypothetical protein